MTPGEDSGVFRGVRSIGVLTASGIGDFVMTVPALEALRRAYPKAEVTVLGDSWHAELLDGRPGPWDRTVAVPRQEGVARLVEDPRAPIHAFVDEHAERHDLVVQMHGGGGDSNAVVRALRPRFSVGPWTPGAERLDRCLPYVERRPEVLRWLEVAELAGAVSVIGSASLLPRLAVTPADLDASFATWEDRAPFIVLHVGARDRRRCWSPANFAAVGRRLSVARGARILVVGSEHDRGASREVVEGIGAAAVDLTGRLTLGATLGLASRSRLFVGNDSGPRHLAAAAGTPTVGIFWVGNAMAFGPLVGSANRALLSYTVDCPVCAVEQVRSRCPHDVSLVDGVGVDEVLRECEAAMPWDDRAEG